MSVRCIIVDDEPLAIEILESYVAKVEQLQLVSTFRNAVSAFTFLQQHSVDLIFLDIQMPKLSGIDFLKTLKHPPKVIFTTAFRDYALQGFDLEVVDYPEQEFDTHHQVHGDGVRHSRIAGCNLIHPVER